MMVALLLVLLWCSGGGVVGEERRGGAAQDNYSRFLNHGWRSRQVSAGRIQLCPKRSLKNF